MQLNQLDYILNHQAKQRHKSTLNSVLKVITAISSSLILAFIIAVMFANSNIVTLSNNDLIAITIDSTIAEGTDIDAVLKKDIFGYGYDSIIVNSSQNIDVFYQVSSDYETYDYLESNYNQFLIFEQVSTDSISQMFNFESVQSSYILKYEFSLVDTTYKTTGFQTNIEFIGDITGDSYPEIGVSFMKTGSGITASNTYAIFTYCVKDSEYQLLGTTPIYDHFTDVNETIPYDIFTGSGVYFNYYDSAQTFTLNSAFDIRESCFVENKYGDIYFVISDNNTLSTSVESENGEYYWLEASSIYVFKPDYDEQTNILRWTLIDIYAIENVYDIYGELETYFEAKQYQEIELN